MAGILTKLIVQSTVVYSGTPGVPGFPGSPALPARCITGTETIRTPASFTILNGKLYYTPASTSTQTVTTCFAAQPARPPIPGIPSTADRTVYTSNIGWTGGGRSVDVMIEGGTFNFTVPYAVAVIVGLVASDQTTSPNEALHAFYIYRSAINIREAGSNVFLCPQTHAPANIYSIQRAGGLTHYLINGVTVYTSATRSTLPLMLDASLYAAGDTVVIEPLSLSTSGRIDGNFEPLVARLGVVNYAEVDGSFEPLRGDLLSRPRTLLDGYFQPLLGLLGNYSQIDGSLEKLTGELESNSISPTVSILDGEFLPLVGLLQHSVRPSGTLDGSFEPLIGRLATGTYADIDGSFAPLAANMYVLEADTALMFSGILYQDNVKAEDILTVSFSSGFAIMSTMAANELLTAEMQAGLSMGMTATLQSLHDANMTAGIGFASSNTSNSYVDGQRNSTAWVTNLDTGAVSMYAGFDFDRMYELDGKYYGVRDSSTYVLDGNTDDGAPIDAFVAFGKQNFGTTALKHVPNFYAGISSTGVLLLRVSTGAGTYTYTPRRTDAISKTQRYDLGKGLKASYYEFELFNQNGCDFELDSVEFLALPSGRRI